MGTSDRAGSRIFIGERASGAEIVGEWAGRPVLAGDEGVQVMTDISKWTTGFELTFGGGRDE
ncbi:hypothetical protein LQF12_02255 [Ruania suaedae]|uniref:hypothetical protein n=1 Tax=Ruania suaedae TaxID=2897774 RepID=UPI001E3B4F59|nr:hypothetical protein [Ruania suaedae]UFU03455.1 hypothetical protein LQF12_02255 [Ruania suaedae]